MITLVLYTYLCTLTQVLLIIISWSLLWWQILFKSYTPLLQANQQSGWLSYDNWRFFLIIMKQIIACIWKRRVVSLSLIFHLKIIIHSFFLLDMDCTWCILSVCIFREQLLAVANFTCLYLCRFVDEMYSTTKQTLQKWEY